MSGRTVIVDYGMGNLHSVDSALRFLGVDPLVSGDPKEIEAAEMLFLPGVGSFFRAMKTLDETGLSEALREAVLGRGCKILGICLGQQLMAAYGVEDGGRAGLGFLEGQVDRIPVPEGAALKVPHVGFNTVRPAPASRLFRGCGEQVDCYFVHSYRLGVSERPGLTATCRYGEDFVAAYEKDNIFCTQFHPEKSQVNGLKLLSNFLAA